MEAWEVSPIVVVTLVFTSLGILGMVWRFLKAVGKSVSRIGDRIERWDLTAEQHPGLQIALTQQVAATAQLTAETAVMAQNMGKIGAELHTHVVNHRELTRQVDEIHQATAN